MSKATGAAGKRTTTEPMSEQPPRKTGKSKSVEAEAKIAEAISRSAGFGADLADERFGLQLGGRMEQDVDEFRKRSLRGLKAKLVKDGVWAKVAL